MAGARWSDKRTDAQVDIQTDKWRRVQQYTQSEWAERKNDLSRQKQTPFMRTSP